MDKQRYEMPEGARCLRFTIPGRISGWQRGRRDTRKSASFTFTPAKMRSDQGIVRHFASEALRASPTKVPLQGPLRMVVQTFRRPPVSWSGKKRGAAEWITGKPDFDNTLKLIADALNGIAYGDDAQIADGRHVRRYDLSGPECVMIELEELEP